MDRNWTDRQREAIETRDCSLLVSAAAGSGKTAVLVQRILEKITDPQRPADIDRMLVVTFTKAAAGEMRERIADALEQALEEKPEDENLRRQSVLLHHAHIMTIHSFCLDVIRNHFHETGIDPLFRVADDGEIKLLQEDIMQALLEEEYDKADPAFLQFMQTAAPGRTDDAAGEMITRFCNYSMGAPWPEEWRNRCLVQIAPESPKELENSEWMKALLRRARAEVQDSVLFLEEALHLCTQPDGPWMYEDTIRKDLEHLDVLSSCLTYGEFRASLAETIKWGRISTKKDPAVSEEKKNRVRKLRDEVKGQIKELQEWFADDLEQVYDIVRNSGTMLRELVRLSGRFQNMFEEEKRARGIADYSDLEHLALQVLVRREGEKNIPTSAAREYADSFQEIMIDEYQDSNLVQDILLKSVSRDTDTSGNRFMVGDVKQSIYRFRLARPELFIEKYSSYSSKEGAHRKIDLNRNFRSRREVLDAVNSVFSRIMIPEVGGVKYDHDAALVYGQGYPDVPEGKEKNPFRAEVILVNVPEDQDGQQEYRDPVRQEAEAAADRILRMVGREKIWDKDSGEYRLVRFSDITILMRSVTGSCDPWTEVLEEMGIPVRTDTGTGYFSAPEVQNMLSFLEILDNPRQDIPLCGVLLSAAGGFTKTQLARIRIRYPQGTLYDACMKYIGKNIGSDIGSSGSTAIKQTDNENADVSIAEDEIGLRLKDFFSLLEDLREKASFTPLHELLWEIMDRTGYRALVAAMPDGERRTANLDMLAEKAETFEQGSYHGLFRFVHYIENLKKYQVDIPQASSEETNDSVCLMSIHKSKGLEFPVVITAGLGVNFNRMDSRAPLILHPQLGAACDWVDPDRRTRMSSLMKKVLSMQTEEENLGEELRILYVAMTRAREKMILMGTVENREKSEEKWKNSVPSGLNHLTGSSIRQASCFMDWLMPAIMMDDCCGKNPCFDVTDWKGGEKETVSSEIRQLTPEDFIVDQTMIYDQAAEERISSSVRERHEDTVQRILPKVSVSELKRKWMEQEEKQEQEFTQHLFLPEDTEGTEEIGGSDRGTLYHKVMQLLDFASFEGQEGFVESQLETMAKCGKIHRDYLPYIDRGKIRRMLETDLGVRMHRAAVSGLLHRETPFVLGVSASRVNSTYDPNEMVLVQGIIDAWFEEKDGIVLLDYKTDRTDDSSGASLVKKYGVQLECYRDALDRLAGKKVKECFLYSFALGKAISKEVI